MRIPSSGLASLLFLFRLTVPAAAVPDNPYFNQPYFISELAFVAYRCGLRDKFWYLRVIYSVKSSIMALDRASGEVPADYTESVQMDRMDQGMANAKWALENEPNACAEKATPDRLDEADRLQRHDPTLLIWGDR